MPTHAIPERAVLPVGTDSTIVPVRVLADDGETAQVLIEGCGIHLRQGQIHDVASTDLRRWPVS
ncbi:hypothetical protein OOK31_25495 [Streptomyces sp. NBC_00249]|uniref:hypothetical protein n=1 Tax=Streptomyces sp. NBC_00249 TaxID=2975690 RepID=UPI002253743A|nr:hypothetical protein [Streptomyces sp. NBC_00249]MCX5197212.1 hypothetical protein [Streptomyces sp. NBC_00249]